VKQERDRGGRGLGGGAVEGGSGRVAVQRRQEDHLSFTDASRSEARTTWSAGGVVVVVFPSRPLGFSFGVDGDECRAGGCSGVARFAD
jgi:hypothetical protein